MLDFIAISFTRSRTVLLLLVFILISGAYAYQNIPKESDPDVAIPIIYVSMSHEGISPEDAERLLVKPMEKELQNIEGIKEMKGTASEGHASVTLEFDAGFDSKQALQDVREKVDIAKSELPDSTEEPVVEEVNVALFPVITVSLSGSIPERALLRIARDLKDRVESVSGVLKVDIGGEREEVLEVLVDPVVMETYHINYEDVLSFVQNNNQLVAAGAMDTGAGRFVIKVPGLIEDLDDILSLPLKVKENTVVTFADIAKVHRTFKDPEGFVRIEGQPAITLEVSKRVGANIINTIAEIRQVVEAERQHLPSSLTIRYLQDKSNDIRDMLTDLQNNIISAIVLVMLVIIAALGTRSAFLVGLAIPSSFLAGILVLYSFGYTLNIVILFSLILVVGMLVDGAIVVTELADRKINQGVQPTEAFIKASQRMAWPVAASTATTLVVFLPLVFWPGVIGEFMKYLPITVMICLIASLFMALVFIPVLGALISRPYQGTYHNSETGAIQAAYLWLLKRLLHYPVITLLVSLSILIGSYAAYGQWGRGVEFFPDIEPQFAQVQIHARGDLSIHEKDHSVRQVEKRILGMPEVRVVYGRSFNSATGNNRAEDVIGVIQLEFIDWQLRRKAVEILDEMRARTADIPGIIIELRKQEDGPSGGKPIQVQLTARDTALLNPAAKQLRAMMEEIGGFADTEDNRPLPGIEWRLHVDREKAARYGANVSLLGNAIQMITTGIKVAEYRPDDAEEEVDIRVRFPFGERNLDQFYYLRVPTVKGMIPVTNFVTLTPAPKTGTLQRVDTQRVITVQSDVEAGLLVDDKVKALRLALDKTPLIGDVKATFKGEDEEQRETMTFLGNAFSIAIFLMLLILVTQFNSIYQSLLVLSAIIFSTSGVLLGLLITKQPFGIVMVGIGIIALAGIVVNNNIVLIDTYNSFKRQGLNSIDAALKTGAIRLRPVFLTALTTVLGLIPMVFAISIDLIGRDISFGAPSTQWWTQLSSAIAGGLSFATLLTLVLTPCLLVLGDNVIDYFKRDKKQPVVLTTEGEASSA